MLPTAVKLPFVLSKCISEVYLFILMEKNLLGKGSFKLSQNKSIVGPFYALFK